MTNRIKEFASWFSIGLILIALLALGAYQTRVFGVDAIEVEGAVRLSAEEILDAAHIEQKQMLWNVDVNQVEANLLNLPWIRKVSLKRVLPSLIEIEVDERQPSYSIQLEEGKRVLMDQEGIFLDRQAEEEAGVQFKASIEAPLDIQYGKQPLNVSEERWNCFLKILNWSGTLVGETKFRLTVLSDEEMQFWLTDALKVEIVDMNDGEYIVDMLARILTDLHRREISAGTILLESGYDARFVQAE